MFVDLHRLSESTGYSVDQLGRVVAKLAIRTARGPDGRIVILDQDSIDQVIREVDFQEAQRAGRAAATR